MNGKTNEKSSIKGLKTQLMGAVAMVIVAAVALSSSTYAWFSINSQVTATGMQVEANTDSAYLLIDDESTMTDATDTYAWPGGTLSLFPAAYDTTVVKNTETAVNAENWYWSVSDDPATSVTEYSKTKVTKLTDFTGYVLHQTLYIGFKAGTATGTYNLTASAAINIEDATGAQDFKPVTVLLVCGDTMITGTSENVMNKVAIGTIDADRNTPLMVDVYIFYDGTHDNVISNNAANLAGAKIDLTFDAAAATTQP